MSVILYKAGVGTTVRGIECEVGVFNEHSYLHNLDNGWFYSPEECYDENPKKDVIFKEVVLDQTDDEIRAKAKKLGIRNWHNMKIENLLNKIEDENGA